ncbi:hypothetical protein LK542_14145 [Massilia sp. IC2-477]|uniref:hypothetical protein n=1 Tax=unclassified Massilia TaxID=2609279 RepID=UPI001D10BEF4|nr:MULTISPECIES: hypothetical protein [unclassified Massilia]MCC2956755.1 hypothetical protein [Massilia sp. IC2-477]MCC2973171.1 hypothetical protein [Massilia sp. IC2-476]
MLRWLENLISQNALTPEKHAKRSLNELRMELYQSEQHLLEMQLRADYYRARIVFLEEVTRKGIEQVSDQRKGLQEVSQALRPGLKLTAAQ